MNLTIKYDKILYNPDYKKINKKNTLYVNEEIQELEGKQHTKIFIDSNIDVNKLVDLTLSIFTNSVFVIGIIKEEILIIVANNEYTEESSEIINFIQEIIKIVKPESKGFDINSTITDNEQNIKDSMTNKKVEPKAPEQDKKVETDEYEIRLISQPLLIDEKSCIDLKNNKEIIEDIKIEIEILDRYQYKLTNNSNIMALVYLFQVQKERKRKFIVNIDEFNKVYDYFQELTKSDITLEKNKVCYYYLDDEDNNNRIAEIIGENYNISEKEFYKLQLRRLRKKISALDYLLSLTYSKKDREATNKGITKFKILEKKDYRIMLNLEKLEYVINNDLLGTKSLKGVPF